MPLSLKIRVRSKRNASKSICANWAVQNWSSLNTKLLLVQQHPQKTLKVKIVRARQLVFKNRTQLRESKNLPQFLKVSKSINRALLNLYHPKRERHSSKKQIRVKSHPQCIKSIRPCLSLQQHISNYRLKSQKSSPRLKISIRKKPK